MKKGILIFMFALVITIFVGCKEVTTTVPVTTPPTTTVAPTTTQPPTTTQAPTTTLAPTDTDPVIVGAIDKTIEKGTAFIPLQGITATDAEDGPITLINYSGDVNPNAEGVYHATYTVTDSDGNVASVTVTITVVFTDVQAPLLTGTGAKTIYVGEQFDPLAGVSATDAVDGAVTVNVTGTVNIWEEGEYTLSYSAEDESGNEATADRVITVTFGDFIFGDATTVADDLFTAVAGVYTSPAISGGVINENLAEFSYVKAVLTISADVAGDVEVAIGSLRANLEEIAVTTTAAEHTFYFVFTEPLVDQTLVLTAGTGMTLDFSVDYCFAEIRDMIAPVLNVPNDHFGYPVNYTEAGLLALLWRSVTAVDNIDGNVTENIVLDYSAVVLNTVGTYQVTYTVEDAEGNESVQTRDVLIGNIIESGFLTDPAFQNEGDDQWTEKSDNGQASITYDSTEEAMIVTIENLGGWASAAGASLAQPSTAFEVDKWYMFTFTVKSSINRKMALRMGLRTDQAHSWIDDFDGVSAGNKLNLTQDYVTYNFFFKLNSLMSSSGEQVFKIELNLGLVDYDYNPVGSVVTFKDVNIFKVISEFLPPTVERQYGAELPVKLTAGDPLPTNFADYVVASDMEGNILVPTIDSSLVNMAVPGTYAVSYSVTDSREATTTFSIDFTVVASENEDTTGPVVTLKPGIRTEIDQFTPAVDLRQVVDAIDAVDGTIIVTSDMIDSGGLNFNVAGVYTVLFSVYDLSGNVGTLSVNVTILDKQAPVINASDATITYGDEFDPLDIISVLDNLDGAIAVENVTVTGADAFLEEGIAKAVGSFDITYTVSDAAGNEGTVTVTITVMDVVWNNEGALPLTIPADEGPTHSTIAYDETEEAYKISGIDVDVDPWDHARLVYYFSKNDIKYGGLYKFVITAKADTATDLYFWLGTTLTADPWIDSFSGVDKKVVQITDQYVTYEVLFTADSESYASLNTWNAAKMQFMYGYLPTDATNNIYIKEFKLVPAAETTYVELHDLAPNDVLTGTLERSTQTVDTIEDAVALSGIPAYTNDWSTGRLTNYYNNTRLEFGETYRFKITVKATTATTLKFRIGTVLSTDPWIDNFAGGLQAISITDEYATYYVEFTVDKENYVSVNNAKFEFTYGYLDDTANTIYIKEFVLEKVIAPVNVDLVLIDDFDYADDAALEAEWTQRTSGEDKHPAPLLNYDAENKAMVFEMPATANDGWHIARKYDSLASFGATDSYKYLAFYMTNNTSKTSAHVWLYWSGNQNSYSITFPAIGETGWAYIDVTTSGHSPTEILDFGLGFNNWTSNPFTGSVSVYQVVLVKDPAELEKLSAPEPLNYLSLDSFEYDDEEDFEANWTQRTSGTDYNPGAYLNLDPILNAMVIDMSAPEWTSSWHVARKYSSLASLGGTNETKYLAFYLTNNTNKTTASAWLYWTGNQNSYAMQLPETGETGWVFVDISKSGKTVSEIIDFGIGFNFSSSDPYTGSVIVYEIALVDSVPKLLESVNPAPHVMLDNFTYVDEEAFEANWTQRTSGANLSPGANMNLDVDNNAMILDMAAPTWTSSWHLARKYSSLASLGGSAETKYLAMYVTNDLNKRFGSIWVYWDGGGYKGTAVPLPRTGESGWIYIDVTAASSGKTVSQITDFALGFEYSSSKPYTGSITVHAIVLVADPEYLPHIDLEPGEVAPVNAAPVVSISNANLATLSGMLLEAGNDISALEATLLGAIEINDAEDGVITPLASMIDYKGLVLTNPVNGTYQIEIATEDSLGLASNVLTLPISIVTMINDLEGFADDAAFKADPLYYGLRTSGDAEWDSTGGLVTVGENNVIEVAYGSSTNGIRINMTKADLTALGATYIGVYYKTSNPLTSTPSFRSFYYDTTHHEISGLQGSIGFINSGTYLYIPISSISDIATSISIVIDVKSPDAGTLTIDNFVFK